MLHAGRMHSVSERGCWVERENKVTTTISQPLFAPYYLGDLGTLQLAVHTAWAFEVGLGHIWFPRFQLIVICALETRMNVYIS